MKEVTSAQVFLLKLHILLQASHFKLSWLVTRHHAVVFGSFWALAAIPNVTSLVLKWGPLVVEPGPTIWKKLQFNITLGFSPYCHHNGSKPVEPVLQQD